VCSSDLAPVSLGAHDSTLINSGDVTNVEIANGGILENNTSNSKVDQNINTDNNSTSNQIKTNAERTAANDVTKSVKNKYLNSTLRIAQNSFFRNKAKKQNLNKQPDQKSKAIKSKDSEFIYSSPMTRKEFVDYKNDSYCIDELETNSSGCINIPFNTLFIVIFIAMIIGILFDILAIRRIAEKNEIP
jgi:hypothetical protein